MDFPFAIIDFKDKKIIKFKSIDDVDKKYYRIFSHDKLYKNVNIIERNGRLSVLATKIGNTNINYYSKLSDIKNIILPDEYDRIVNNKIKNVVLLSLSEKELYLAVEKDIRPEFEWVLNLKAKYKKLDSINKELYIFNHDRYKAYFFTKENIEKEYDLGSEWDIIINGGI